jgi:hypothetical protein
MSVLLCSLNARADDFSITIDAELDTWYFSLTGPEDGLVFMPAACHVLDIGDETTWPVEDDDISAIVWFAYDDVYMYVYTEVTDDFVLGTNERRYKNDCIELKFDPDPSKMSTGPTDNTRLCALPEYSEDADGPTAVEGAQVDNLSGLGDWQPIEGVDYVRRLTDDGYVLEFRLPLDYIESPTGGKLRENESGTFGMAINFCENDDVDRTSMLQWSAGHTDAVHPTPALHGSVTFMENHILKLEAVSPQDPSIVNANADEWYLNPNETAWALSPADGSVDVLRDKVLGWMKGNNPVTYDVYLGKDFNDVSQATKDNPLDVLVSIGQEESTYDPSPLDLDQMYYWRIDEVSEADPNNPRKGEVLSFTTRVYATIDDFESYNDLNESDEGSNRIYLTWSDGYATPNINGSTIGYPDPIFSNDEHFAETNTVYQGSQSGPFLYNNTTASYSEVTLPMSATAVGSDWTQDGFTILTLWFYGETSNPATENLYVKLNDSRVSYSGDAADLSAGEWIQWNINLSDFTGLDPANVTVFTVGTERTGATGGEGILFLDNIILGYVVQ